jgi:hypothetical protein
MNSHTCSQAGKGQQPMHASMRMHALMTFKSPEESTSLQMQVIHYVVGCLSHTVVCVITSLNGAVQTSGTSVWPLCDIMPTQSFAGHQLKKNCSIYVMHQHETSLSASLVLSNSAFESCIYHLHMPWKYRPKFQLHCALSIILSTHMTPMRVIPLLIIQMMMTQMKKIDLWSMRTVWEQQLL